MWRKPWPRSCGTFNGGYRLKAIIAHSVAIVPIFIPHGPPVRQPEPGPVRPISLGAVMGGAQRRRKQNPFRDFNSSSEVIRLAVMLYVRYPLSPRQVEDLLFERGIDISHETVRFWWNRFGPLVAADQEAAR